jgi:hypothetical protein
MPLPLSAHSSHIGEPHRPHMRIERASPRLPHMEHSTIRNTSIVVSIPVGPDSYAQADTAIQGLNNDFLLYYGIQMMISSG